MTLSNRITANSRLAIAAPLIKANMTNRSKLSVLLIVSALMPVGNGYARLDWAFIGGSAVDTDLGGVVEPFGRVDSFSRARTSSTSKCAVGSDEGPDAAVGAAPGVIPLA